MLCKRARVVLRKRPVEREDPNIEGVKIGEILHKLSQFADDSTLIARPSDMPFFETHLRT